MWDLVIILNSNLQERQNITICRGWKDCNSGLVVNPEKFKKPFLIRMASSSPNGPLNGFEDEKSQSSWGRSLFELLLNGKWAEITFIFFIFFGKVSVPVAVCSNGSLALPSIMDH